MNTQEQLELEAAMTALAVQSKKLAELDAIISEMKGRIVSYQPGGFDVPKRDVQEWLDVMLKVARR